MVKPNDFLRASIDAGKGLFCSSPLESAPDGMEPRVGSVMVPIRSIGPGHSERITVHLLALGASDRYLRFGYAANDEQIRRYAAGIDFERDDVFGIYNRKIELIAMAHLAFSTNPELKSCAEFGVSVLAHARGRRYGSRLFDRAVMHARNEGVYMVFIHALSENTVMLNIARKAGAIIERDGSDCEAYLKLPPADIDSRITEIALEQIAQTDYRLKVQAKQFWSLLAMVQEVRRGVQNAREKTRA